MICLVCEEEFRAPRSLPLPMVTWKIGHPIDELVEVSCPACGNHKIGTTAAETLAWVRDPRLDTVYT